MFQKITQYFILLIFMTVESSYCQTGSFRQQQQQFQRVAAAYAEKESFITGLLDSKNIKRNSLEIFIRIFKQEKTVEIWGKNKSDTSFRHLIGYSICSMSGMAGPKRRQGDGQVPEGFYHIDRFNPVSMFHLSLGINYPNVSDKIVGTGGNLGGDIFIHGSCVTIGCIPITDDKIKELYIFAVEARNSGQQKIPVHIFPAGFNTESFSALQNSNRENTALAGFWNNIKDGYDYFEEKKKIPVVTVRKDGVYAFK